MPLCRGFQALISRHSAPGCPPIGKNERSLRQDRADRLEIMDHALVTDVFDCNTCCEQLVGVGTAFVSHRPRVDGALARLSDVLQHWSGAVTCPAC